MESPTIKLYTVRHTVMLRLKCFLYISIITMVFTACENKSENRKSNVFTLTDDEVKSVDISLENVQNLDFWSDYPDDVLANELVQRMSDEELLAQMFMFGWAGAEPSFLLRQWVDQRGLGSIKVFGWNTDDIHQVAKSITILQQMSQDRPLKIPLYVATDQEGGWIRHVKGETSITPGNLSIGASGYPMDAWYTGYYISMELRALGINMNFAPTVDLYSNRDSTVIGPRSFGENPDYAGILGAAFSAGSEAAGVIPTAKHFPGHGDTGLDSHGRLPVIDIDADTFEKRELVPFKYLIKENIPAIMSGHLSFPSIVPEGTPASLSKTFLSDILRKRLGYEGLIITDDMMMNGATMYAGSLSNAYRLAIEAGNDIILSSTTAQLNEPLWTSNLYKMSVDEDFRNQVKASAKRVILSKLHYFKGKNPVPLYPELDKIDENIPNREGQSFFLEQACRSVTVYKKGKYFPLSRDFSKNKRILLVGPIDAFFTEAKKTYEGTNIFKFDDNPGPIHIDWMSKRVGPMASNYDLAIVCVDDEGSAQIISKLKEVNIPVIVLSAMAPFPAIDMEDWADTILLGYSDSDFTFKALFSALAGDYTPKGTFPMKSEVKE